MHAVQTLRTAGGELPVRAVAALVGLSERQLERLFDERVGYGPKTFARVVRMQRAVGSIGRSRGGRGTTKRAEVPHEGALGFVLLENEAGEIMLQTRASLAADMETAAKLEPHTVLFVEVKSLAVARSATRGARVLLEERTTFYGMRESVVVDPGGTIVIFAEKS